MDVTELWHCDISPSHPFSYPEPFLRAVRRGALAKSISELASDWLVLTQYTVFLPCFYGIRLWIWPEPLVAPRVRRVLGTRMRHTHKRLWPHSYTYFCKFAILILNSQSRNLVPEVANPVPGNNCYKPLIGGLKVEL